MTDKELIKEEIERRIKEISDACDGVIMVETISVEYNTLCNIMDYINSIPEENHFEDNSEMVSEDLDEEIDRFEDWLNNFNQSDYPTSYTVRDIARHFAEWQKKKDQSTIELAEDHAMLAGMNRMKEEMMKDAVEAEVFIDYNINFGYGSLTANIDLDEQHLKEGDKVKIIICKPEQQ